MAFLSRELLSGEAAKTRAKRARTISLRFLCPRLPLLLWAPKKTALSAQDIVIVVSVQVTGGLNRMQHHRQRAVILNAFIFSPDTLP